MSVFDSGYSRKHFPFDCFKKGSATSGNIGNAVGETELVDASYGVATADEREGTIFGGFHDSVGDCTRTYRKVVEFKHACGSSKG